jgi:hypothetical protein
LGKFPAVARPRSGINTLIRVRLRFWEGLCPRIDTFPHGSEGH